MVQKHTGYLLRAWAWVFVAALAACGGGRSPPTAAPAQPAAAPTRPPSPTALLLSPTPSPVPTAENPREAGRALYAEVCAPCHGNTATGIEGIGVDLTTSPLVAGMTHEELTAFLVNGLSINSIFNTTGIKMPPMGGRTDLAPLHMSYIATYLQSVNTATPDPEAEQVVAYRAWLEEGGQEEIAATPEVGNEGLTGAALAGQTTYLRFCAVCHGPHAEGVESLGKGFRDGDFIPSMDNKALAQFIAQGRPANHELNETGIEMLPYGGQAYLTDEQLNELVAYIRVVSSNDTPSTPVPSGVENLDTERDAILASVAEDDRPAVEIILSTSPRCYTCHVIGNEGNQGGPGPSLNGLKDRAGERKPGLSAHAYVRESILNPGAYIVDECPRGPCVDVMVKNYREKLTDEQLETLIDYLLSLEAQ